MATAALAVRVEETLAMAGAFEMNVSGGAGGFRMCIVQHSSLLTTLAQWRLNE
jgi:hypothetical protein